MSPESKPRIRRFTPIQRIFHLLLIVFFLTQGMTGLARMYIETPWGKMLAWIFGGYEAALFMHKLVGILMLCGFGVYILYLLFGINWKRFPGCLFSPESLVPQPRDIKDFFQHVGWFFRITEAPPFDRWGYWEKFDYWAVFWGIPLLGITGLLLADPIFASRIVPGWILNVVLWIHRIEAILAMAHIFIIHFFVAHFRRHNFPMDRTMFEGSADFDAVRHERPAWIERLKLDGTLETALVAEAKIGQRILYYAFGYAAVATGIFLLIGAILNAPDITW